MDSKKGLVEEPYSTFWRVSRNKSIIEKCQAKFLCKLFSLLCNLMLKSEMRLKK